ncbi:hypothetical protein [Duganella phyllosphaerae]|uniref:Uncharacterized protein n=1 Tax=Duganella phyllosphaerae TaxID=762836 RepID=A0A1E7WJC2_9BURK|nr:hypothetical protein [Duganella phyllosphaerae]OEZ98782.1 hypothetical protein DUPY_29620 [Duganella phyllosphaerae]
MSATIKTESREAWLRKALARHLQCAAIGRQMMMDCAMFDQLHKVTVIALGSAAADMAVAACLGSLGGMAGEW